MSERSAVEGGAVKIKSDNCRMEEEQGRIEC
jgi:hypothetical protein